MPPTPAATSTSARLRSAIAQYGRVAIAVHIGVSTVSFAGLYLAIRSSFDVEGLLHKVGLLPASTHPSAASADPSASPPSSHSPDSLERSGTQLPETNLSSAASSASPYSVAGTVAGRKVEPGSSSEVGAEQSLLHSSAGTPGDVRDVPEKTDAAPGVSDSGEAAAAGLIGSGGALAVAWLCNKALIPVRVPITLALTPPIARFLVARGFRV